MDLTIQMIGRLMCLWVFGVLWCGKAARAEPPPSPGDSSTAMVRIADDLRSGAASVGRIMTSPLRWDGGDVVRAGTLLTLSGGTFLLDDEMRTVMLRHHSSFNDRLERIGSIYGSPQFAGGMAAALYVTGLISGDDNIRETGLMLIETLVGIGFIEIPLRAVAGRARPYVGEGSTSFRLLTGLDQDRSSFLSGHAAASAGMSVILAHAIDHPAATVVLSAAALTTSLSRMYADRHWFSDAFMGSVIGVTVAIAVIDLHRHGKEAHAGWMVAPSPGGLSCIFMF